MQTKTKTRRTYTIQQYGTDSRVSLGSDGKLYMQRRTSSGKWSRRSPCSIVSH